MDNKIIDLLTTYAAMNKAPLVNYQEFLKYAENYAYNNNLTDVINNIRDHKLEIIPTLMQWEYKGYCTIVRKEGVVESILIHSIIEDMVRTQYTQIENYPELPYPDEAFFGVSIPDKIHRSIEIRNDFVNFLESIDTCKQPIIKITFPGGLRSLLVTKDIVKTWLIECSLLKLSRYLQYKMNAGYIHSRLETLLSGSLEALRIIMSEIVTKPKKALNSIFEADDFAFKFWSQFSNIIIKDYRDKKEKTDEEHGFCQSAHILGLFIGYQKSITQRENQKELDFSHIEKLMKKPPYAFTIRDMYNLKDSHGVKYIDKYSRDFIHEFIRRTTKIEDASRLPFLIRVKVDTHGDFFIQKDIILPIFITSLTDARRLMEQEYKDEWQTLLRNNTQLPTMLNDSDFCHDVGNKVKGRFPIIRALLNPHLLYVIKEEPGVSADQKTQIEQCFSKKNTLKPIDELLELSRTRLLHEVKMLLPIWFTVPVVKHIYFFFRWLAGKGNKGFRAKAKRLWLEVKTELKRGADKDYASLISMKKEEAEEETQKIISSKAQKQKYRDAINAIKVNLIGKDINLDELIEDLSDKWNPLYEQTAKANLVEDVNCFIRDYLRQIKKTFRVRPPTAEQVRNLAAHLCQNKNLKDIKKRETLRTYIEVYMIRLLEELFQIR
ncbi:MAG: hypothetical protein JW904_03780 [Spirochaetales bacterium]|nr:hypothetical protein [Spirochaetales bacterium]